MRMDTGPVVLQKSAAVIGSGHDGTITSLAGGFFSGMNGQIHGCHPCFLPMDEPPIDKQKIAFLAKRARWSIVKNGMDNGPKGMFSDFREQTYTADNAVMFYRSDCIADEPST